MINLPNIDIANYLAHKEKNLVCLVRQDANTLYVRRGYNPISGEFSPYAVELSVDVITQKLAEATADVAVLTQLLTDMKEVKIQSAKEYFSANSAIAE